MCCFVLNVCVPLKFIYQTLIYNMVVLRAGPFGRQLDHMDVALMYGISALTEGAYWGWFTSFTWGMEQKEAMHEEWALTRH
jgi:hypothetical protein